MTRGQRRARRQACVRDRWGTAGIEQAHAVYVHVTYTGEARNPIGSRAEPDMAIAVGFGSATVTVDGKPWLDGDPRGRDCYAKRSRRVAGRNGWLTIKKIERELRRLSRHRDTRSVKIEAHIHGPLWSATWERRLGNGRWDWICTSAGEGFA